MSRGRARAGFLAGLVLLAAAIAPIRTAGAAPLGVWTAPFSEAGMFDAAPPRTAAEARMLPTAVSAVLLPNGRIVYWDGLAGFDCKAPIAVDGGRCGNVPDRSRVLDLTGDGTPLWLTPRPETGGKDSLFCADQRLLGDGRVLAAGGTRWGSDPVNLEPVFPEGPGGTAEIFGSNAARTYTDSAEGGRWKVVGDMNHRRWYPTLVTLPDGSLMVASGVSRLVYNDALTNVHDTEIFDPAAGAWTESPDNHDVSLPLYARLHLLPDGTVFYGGTGQMWSPAGQAYDEALWARHLVYDPAAPAGVDAWTLAGVGSFGARSSAFSTLLPLKAPYDEAKILVAGGTLGSSPGSYIATDLTEVVTVRNGRSSSVVGAPMNNRRWYPSGVLLPDGTVLAFSGGDKDGVIFPGTEVAVRQAELWDGSRWIPLASGARDRTYHNMAMLLPDGSVLVGGHSPINYLYGAQPEPENDERGFASNLRDPSFERFYPPYLFRGPRSSIERAPAGVSWSSTFDVKVDVPEGSTVTSVALVRTPSVTHVTDADARMVELEFTREGDALQVVAPPSGNVAPPGYYYLFVNTDSGSGPTPSKARIVRVGADANDDPALAPFGS